MFVKDGMSEVVVSVGPTHTLREAACKMVERKVGAALALAEEPPGPRITPEPAYLPSTGAREAPDPGRAAAQMPDSVIAAGPDWSLERAAAEMTRRNIRHLVVYDDSDVVGVLSMRDIVRCWTSDGATSGMTPD